MGNGRHDQREDTHRWLGLSVRAWLTLILLLAVAFRLLFTFGYVRGVLGDLPGDQTNDGYDALAEHLYQGEGYRIHLSHPPTLERPPAYPLLIYLVFQVAGPEYAVVQVVHALLGALCAYLLYRLGHWALGGRAGLVAALLFAGYPSAVQYSANICSENLFFPLVAALAYFLCRAVGDRSAGYAIAAGLAWGLANLTRGTLLPFPLLLAPGLLVLKEIRVTWRRWIPRLVVMLAAAACVMAPWIIRNYRLTETFVPVSTWSWAPFYHGQQCAKRMLTEEDLVRVDKEASRRRHEIVVERLYGGDRSRAYESPRDFVRHEQVARDLVLSGIREDPWGTLGRTMVGVPLSWFQTLREGKRIYSAILHLPVLLLTLLGTMRLWRRKRERFARIYPAILIILFFNALTAFVFPYVRYMAPAIAVAFVLAGYELTVWWSALAARIARRSAPA